MTHSFPTRRSSDLARQRARMHQPHRGDAHDGATEQGGGAEHRGGATAEHREGDANALHQAGQRKAATVADMPRHPAPDGRSEEHTSELQSLMRISYAVFCLKKNKQKNTRTH